MERKKSGKRGFQQVISSLIMCGVVLAIGAGVWGVTHSYTSLSGSSYYESVMVSVEKIKERFCIENVGVETDNKLRIWILNYGEIDITIERVLVKGGGLVSSHLIDSSIPRGEICEVDVTPIEGILTTGRSVSIEVISDRGNKAYDSIIMP